MLNDLNYFLEFNMKVYEMVFSTGIEEQESLLYFSDDIKNRKDFISKMKNKIILEIKKHERNQEDIELFNFYYQIYFETYANLEKMQDDFINKRFSKLDDYTFLKVEEKSVM